MMNWLETNWINIVLIALLALMVFFMARSLIRAKKAGRSLCSSCSCGGACGGCPLAGKCHPAAPKD